MAAVKQHIEEIIRELSECAINEHKNYEKLRSLYKDCVIKIRSALKVTKNVSTKQFYLSGLIKVFSIRDKYLRKKCCEYQIHIC